MRQKRDRRAQSQIFEHSLLGAACLAALIPLGGCHSHTVGVTIANHGPALRVVELDYPSASFGANRLATGAQFNYRFKIQGSGPLSLSFEDNTGKTHTAQGPTVQQGQEGSLLITIAGEDSAVTWTPKLK